MRNSTGFQGFTVFSEARDLETSLFYAESEGDRKENRGFSDTTPDQKTFDFPRRLFLYRTFMQAMRIRAAAKTYRGRTILVVVGSMHKDDIERILGGNPEIELVQPSSVGQPSAEETSKVVEDSDLYAIAAFNLLGTQAKHGPVNWEWVGRVVSLLEARNPSPETRLLRTRFNVLTEKITAEDAIRESESVARASAPAASFHFTGVKDRARVDSYFDPFGNLSVRRRALLEMARETGKAGREAEARRLRDELLGDPSFSSMKRAQVSAYWEEYVLHTF